MALTLDSLLKREALLPLLVGEDELNITYRPAALTWEVRGKLRGGVWDMVPPEDAKKPAADVIPAAIEAYCALMAGVLIAWDMVDEKGKTLPIDALTLMRFPLDFVTSLGREVAKDSLVNPQIRATSASTSPTTAS